MVRENVEEALNAALEAANAALQEAIAVPSCLQSPLCGVPATSGRLGFVPAGG